jgi:zinc protease
MNRRRNLSLKAAVLAVALLAGAVHAAAEGPTKITTVEGITEYRYDNGLILLLFPDPSKPTVTVNLTVFVGSRHEGYGEAGMAHLLEHMVFKGTPTHADIPKALQERGARFNGSTSVDRTNYFETLPATDENLDFAVGLEADRMVNSLIRAEDLASEFSVVRNEFERGENDPSNVLNERMSAAAYEWHNYGKTTIGNRSDIERVPVVNLRQFYKKFYQPDNAMLVVAGKFDEAKALAVVSRHFGSLPKPERVLTDTYTEEPAQDGERQVTLRRVGDVTVVGLMYHVPAGPHEEFPAVQVLANVLGASPSGRLYKALVDTKMATSAAGFAMSLHDPGLIQFFAQAPKDAAVDQIRDVMLREVEEVVQTGVTDEEVDRARTRILKMRELMSADSSRLAVQLSEWGAQGDWRLYFINRDRLEKVTSAQVVDAARRYLTRNNRTLGMFSPTQDAERIGIPAAPPIDSIVKDYKGREAVAVGEAFNPSPLAIEERTTRGKLGGLKVATLPRKTRNETVQLSLSLRYGNEKSLATRVVACEILPELMTRGTKSMSREQIEDELDRHKARLTARGSAGQMTFSIQTQREHLIPVINVLKQVLREPALASSEFEILKRNARTALEEEVTDPQGAASRNLVRRLNPYPSSDVRYEPTAQEEMARIDALTLDDVKGLYADFLGGQNGELVIMGDFAPDETVSALSESLTGWTAKEPYARITRPASDKVVPGREVISIPDKANAVYLAGLTFAMKDTDPDYPALTLGNFILGGGTLSSRLGNRVRQKEGLSYGVGSGFAAGDLDPRGAFNVFAIYNPENVAKVEAAIREEVELLIKTGITDEELERAKSGYLASQEIQRTNDQQLTSTLAGTLHADRTMKYYAEVEKKIVGLTKEQVREALLKYLDPEKLVIVVSGSLD